MPKEEKKTAIEPNFETAMDRLEEIVEQMESGKLVLDDVIGRYEEGMKLVKICQERLASAEQRIEMITRTHDGKAAVKNFDPGAEGPRAPETAKEDTENGEVRLF